MAIFNLTYDSETKEFSVTQDGTPVDNVSYVSMYTYSNYDEKPEVHFTVESRTEQNGVKYCNVVYASEFNIKDKLAESVASMLKLK